MTATAISPFDVPPARRAAIEALAPHLLAARRVALSTHINADEIGRAHV